MDPILYETELGRGRPEILDRSQKDAIIRLVISSRENREKEAWQAIEDGDFLAVAPKISISTFENVMYKRWIFPKTTWMETKAHPEGDLRSFTVGKGS